MSEKGTSSGDITTSNVKQTQEDPKSISKTENFDDYSINYPIGKFDLSKIGVSTQTINLINSSMMHAKIIPRKMEWGDGLTSFQFPRDWITYNDLIKLYDVTLPGRECVDVMFVPDSWPTESFSNEYGASFLSNILDVFKGSLGDLSQMLGSTTLEDSLSRLQTLGQDKGMIRETLGGAAGKMSEWIKEVKEAAKGPERNMKTMGAGILTSAATMLAGSRVDFPSVWKDSSFAPTYTMTIKLYNPYPGNVEMTKKYITRPLASLLCLALPHSSSLEDIPTAVSTYTWPFFCSVNCPGVFTMPFSAISNISIQKSGDQPLATFNQLITQINVTMDFVSLYPTMIAGSPNITNRLELSQYLKNLEEVMDTGLTINESPTVYPSQPTEQVDSGRRVSSSTIEKYGRSVTPD